MLRTLINEYPGVKIVVGTPFIYLEDISTLVMADLHLGFEEAASRGLYYTVRKTSGYNAVFLPRIQLRRAIEMLNTVLEHIKVERVVINGDLKHAFDRLLRQEREEVTRLVEFLKVRGVDEIIVVRGNHDNFIKPLLRKLNVDFVDALSLRTGNARVLMVHGHEDVNVNEYNVVIIGHEHPSLRCFDVYRLPCFLKIPLTSSKVLVVMPATGPYHPGVLVSPNPQEYLSPLIKKLETLESASIVTWIKTGEAIQEGESLGLEFPGVKSYISIERYIVNGVEYGLVEFSNYNIARTICEV